tara:strand:+ start:254 stop:382 length:129 start_codon:yes stop_codon:yes gene_type:complete
LALAVEMPATQLLVERAVLAPMFHALVVAAQHQVTVMQEQAV